VKFICQRYPQLRVALGGRKYAAFTEVERADPNEPRRGELETTDKEVIDAVKALPAEFGIQAVGKTAKTVDE
jgi:hypothetical protein